MTVETLSPVPVLQFFDNNGRPLVGGKLFTYEAGTSTKKVTYEDSVGITPNTNPIILDFRGECRVWIPPNVAYKYVLSPSNDTDPPTHPIWTVDQIVNSQLLTVYGGTDTGSANAYILNFTTPITAYEDGWLIYWLPAHTNTGASTMNVNGLGPVAITNQDGSALYAGQIVANVTVPIIYQGTGFILLPSAFVDSTFAAYRITSIQNMPNSTTSTVVFNSAVTNPQGTYDAATGIFTANVAGTFLFTATINIQNNTASNIDFGSAYFSKNNATSGSGSRVELGYGQQSVTFNPASNPFVFTGTAMLTMAIGDTMRIKVTIGAGPGANMTLNTGSYFSGQRLA